VKIFYSSDYVAAAYAFDTTRKSAEIARSLVERPIDGVILAEPVSLTADFISTVHDPQYVEAVRTGKPKVLAESSGFIWDPGIWKAVTASNGGAVEAALEALRNRGVAGSLSSGLHHAGYASGGGFCTFNGLVLAAVAAQSAGACKVLIVDFDAHFGDGTEELIKNREGIVMVDVSTARLPDNDTYFEMCHETFSNAAETDGPFDLVIYNAGMDPHEDCFLGGRKGITDAVMTRRESMVFRNCFERGWPVAFVLAGGYSNHRLPMNRLVELHRITIQAAVDPAIDPRLAIPVQAIHAPRPTRKDRRNC